MLECRQAGNAGPAGLDAANAGGVAAACSLSDMTIPAEGKCVFCDIIRREAPAEIVAEWIDAIAIVPLNPVVPGHVLVIPSQHITDFADDPVVAESTMFRASCLASAKPEFEQCNLITSRGPAATQTVFHLHVHLVPRAEGDMLRLPWS